MAMKTVLYPLIILLIIDCLKCENSSTVNEVHTILYTSQDVSTSNYYLILFSSLRFAIWILIALSVHAITVICFSSKWERVLQAKECELMNLKCEIEVLRGKLNLFEMNTEKTDETQKTVEELKVLGGRKQKEEEKDDSSQLKIPTFEESSKKKKEAPKDMEKKKIIKSLDEEKEEKKISIKKVKWDENPIGYHETGVGVDQVEIPTPSTRGGSSSIMTASIRQVKKL
ncbi:hypothetical protein CRE_12322 [Caenorhabditis remanei]|uniref:Uncharacterized protein n=1 Tax=Caenorhabditis remanei TaxID=31234 RepID=E3NH20_CAERE|nr:hypothetical protein CRE_12322 [Caenorhabditis remanei]